jgi:hypothetical protein
MIECHLTKLVQLPSQPIAVSPMYPLDHPQMLERRQMPVNFGFGLVQWVAEFSDAHRNDGAIE